MLAPVLVTAASDPVTLNDAKLHCRVDHEDDDALISAYLGAAVQKLETILGTSLGESLWREYFDRFDCINLSKWPVREGSTIVVKYLDGDEIEQTVTSSDYRLELLTNTTKVLLATGSTWPTSYATTRNDAVRVEYTAGLVAVPPALRVAVLLDVGAMYESREAVSNLSFSPTGMYDDLIRPFRRPYV